MGDSRKKEHKSASQVKDADQHQRMFFVDSAGIDREVITADICHYLGNDALGRPGEYTDKISGRALQGFFITAYRPPTMDIRSDSGNWQAEKRRNQLRDISLRDSDTSSQGEDEEGGSNFERLREGEWSNWEWLPKKSLFHRIRYLRGVLKIHWSIPKKAYSVTKNAESADPLRDGANARIHQLPATVLDTVGSAGTTSLNEDQFLVAAIGGSAAIVLGVANTVVGIANCLSARKSAKAAELSAKVAADKLAFEKEEAAAKRIAEAKANSASQDYGQAGQARQGSLDLAAPVQTTDGVTADVDTNESTTNKSQMNDPLLRSPYVLSPRMIRMARATQASPSEVLVRRRQLKKKK